MLLAFADSSGITEYPINPLSIRKRFPNTSFPKNLVIENLREFGVVEVKRTAQPVVDTTKQHIKEVDPISSRGVWQQTYEITNLTAEELAKNNSDAEAYFREKRNRRLAASDWTQLNNTALTEDKQKEWNVYRQELRDITQKDGFPTNITWPKEPD